MKTVLVTGSEGQLAKHIFEESKEEKKFNFIFSTKKNLDISNKEKAKGHKYARKFKIKKKIINYLNKKNAEKTILDELKKNKIDLVCLAGFMKILSNNLIKNFRGKIINIHPSLLPKYKGLNTHQRALNNKEKYSGCTVHYVSSKLDSGKIILQKKVKIFKNDTCDRLSKRVLRQEHLLYPRALKKILSNL